VDFSTIKSLLDNWWRFN